MISIERQFSILKFIQLNNINTMFLKNNSSFRSNGGWMGPRSKKWKTQDSDVNEKGTRPSENKNCPKKTKQYKFDGNFSPYSHQPNQTKLST